MWEDVDVDWDEFHPAARQLLDDPFFWEVADDYAPHGNDTGADLLEFYKEELTEDAGLDTARWTQRLLRSWGATGDDDLAELMRDEAWIAAAFAELKLRGRMTSEVAHRARAAVERLRLLPAEDPNDSADSQRAVKYAKIAEKLASS